MVLVSPKTLVLDTQSVVVQSYCRRAEVVTMVVLMSFGIGRDRWDTV